MSDYAHAVMRQEKQTTKEFQIEIALDSLNALILEKGWEFPEAMRRTLQQFAVSQAELTKAYDKQGL